MTAAKCTGLLLICSSLAAPAFAFSSDAFAERLSTLAAKCDELGLKDQAEITRGWAIPRSPGRRYLFLPVTGDPTAPKAGAPEAAKQWHRKFLEMRRERAAELFLAAKTAAGDGDAAKAYQLLFEALREDPEHEAARRILGYVKSGGDWKLPGDEKAILRQPTFNHPKTGWRARGWWSVETAHFQIASNDQRELKEASQELEKLDALWRQIFFRYCSTPEALKARISGGNESLAPERPKMQVVLFKTQEEYAGYVGKSHPKAASTLGIYDDEQRVAYFFGGDKSVYPTWYHEATHQLFREAVPGTIDGAGKEGDFWAVEAVALYMQSLAEHNGFWTVGGWESDALQISRYRVLSRDFHLPLVKFRALNREQIQKSDDIKRIYSQAAGLGHFLMDGENGEYCSDLIDLLSGIYQGRNTRDLLCGQQGTSPENLDKQFQHFLEVTNADVTGTIAPERLKNLSLCRASITDAGLAPLASTRKLEWLDLSWANVGDSGLSVFAKNAGLRQLFLEGTKVTSAALNTISGFKLLEELDLSGLAIHDDDLKQIAQLRLLKTLYLTGCPITDSGLEHLRGLKLQQIDIGGTKVTPGGIQKLKAAIPKLKSSP